MNRAGVKVLLALPEANEPVSLIVCGSAPSARYVRFDDDGCCRGRDHIALRAGHNPRCRFENSAGGNRLATKAAAGLT